MWGSSSKTKSSKIQEQAQEIYNEFIPGSQDNGYSAIYRKKGLHKMETTLDPELKTVRDMLERTVKTFGNKNGFGTSSFT